MIRKPFQPPSFVRPDVKTDEPPHKKRRVSSDAPSVLLESNRKPLNPVQNTSSQPLDPNERYYAVLWRKYTTKKHKTWDGDGILAVVGGYAVLKDSENGKELGSVACGRPLLVGSILSIGGKEVEIDDFITKEDYMAGRMFLGKPMSAQVQVPPKPTSASNGPIIDTTASPKIPTARSKQVKTKKPRKGERGQIEDDENVPPPPPPPKPLAARKQFKTPVLHSTVVPKTKSATPQPRHDPKQPSALIMKRPMSCPKGKQLVDVVVDPILCKHLRNHQRDGVQFLYECVMGMRCEGEGAIMADEMGLGKTLQTITLLWTLMKQNPIYDCPPVVTKALIVCPAGLVDNWRREFRKWLGNERVGVFVAEAKNRKITNFTMGKAYNIMIVGYEMLRTVQEELKKGVGIDIVIADEGHRLKTANNKAMLAIQSLNTERRIILSGTPLQNDLSEFYTAIDFVNPGLLGKRAAFKREFETPIVRSRQPNATESELEKGEARWKELVSLTSKFMIRRTAEVLSKYLPPKTEHIVFCKPTVAQAAAYRAILSSPIFAVALGNTDMALQLINILKKICNSPYLLKSSKTKDDTPSEMLQSLLPLIPPHVLSSHASSTKLRVLDSLIHRIHSTTKEKVVIVSNYTTTLDMIERLLTSLSYTYLRLDGSTPASKRQPLVEKFNRTPQKAAFAFLLSAKSGGVGLNLIGASRIILFDLDWNPATDLQAMARIHRDGQKLPCKIYRLLVQGALDEKIFQRQVMKMGLADAVVDNKASAASFSREELRDLFKLDEGVGCRTHELSGCACRGRGAVEDATLATPTQSPAENDDDDAVSIKEEEEEEDVDNEEEEDDFLALRKASNVDMDAQELYLKTRRSRSSSKSAGNKPKLTMLMEYAHIDTQFLRPRDAKGAGGMKAKEKPADEDEGKEEEDIADDMALTLDDDVLVDVLREPDCRVGFVLSKGSS